MQYKKIIGKKGSKEWEKGKGRGKRGKKKLEGKEKIITPFNILLISVIWKGANEASAAEHRINFFFRAMGNFFILPGKFPNPEFN